MTTTDERAPVRSSSTRAFAAVCIAWGVGVLDLTMINIALPDIRADLHASLAELQWVVSAYAIMFAGFLLTAGLLGDRFGQQRVLLVGMSTFGAVALLCSLAPEVEWLIVARAVQGLGAAAMVPAAFALITDVFPDPRARVRALGIWMSVAAFSTTVGPVIAGVLVDAFGWQGIFWVHAPLLAVAVVLARGYPSPTPHAARQLDLMGLVLGVLVLGLVTFVLVEGRRAGWLASQVVVAGTVVLAAGAALAVVERRAPAPMLPLRLLGESAVRVAAGLFAVVMFVTLGGLFVLTLYLQTIHGYSPLRTGLAFVPLGGVSIPGTLISGRVTARIGPRAPMVAGFVTMTVGALLLATIDTDTSYATLGIGLALLGGGSSIAVPPTLSIMSSHAVAGETGVASGVVNVSRQFGGLLGVAVLGAFIGRDFVSGMHAAFVFGAALLGLAALTALTRVGPLPTRPATPGSGTS